MKAKDLKRNGPHGSLVPLSRTVDEPGEVEKNKQNKAIFFVGTNPKSNFAEKRVQNSKNERPDL